MILFGRPKGVNIDRLSKPGHAVGVTGDVAEGQGLGVRGDGVDLGVGSERQTDQVPTGSMERDKARDSVGEYSTDRPQIALVAGDPFGDGARATYAIASDPQAREVAQFALVIDGHALDECIGAGQVLRMQRIDNFDAMQGAQYRLNDLVGHIDASASDWPSTPTAEMDPSGGQATLRGIDLAASGVRSGSLDAMVIGAYCDGALKLGGMSEPSLLAYLNAAFGNSTGRSFVVAGDLWTASVLPPMPIAGVASALSSRAIVDTVGALEAELQRYGVAECPRIAVTRLNPMGAYDDLGSTEEFEQIRPAIAALNERGIDVHGPLAVGEAIHGAMAGRFDGVVTMHGDQTDAFFDIIGRHRLVEVIGGLPKPIVAVQTPVAGGRYLFSPYQSDPYDLSQGTHGATYAAVVLALKAIAGGDAHASTQGKRGARNAFTTAVEVLGTPVGALLRRGGAVPADASAQRAAKNVIEVAEAPIFSEGDGSNGGADLVTDGHSATAAESDRDAAPLIDPAPAPPRPLSDAMNDGRSIWREPAAGPGFGKRKL